MYYDKGWRIDGKLVKWHKELYNKWIDDDEWIGSYKNQRVQITQQFSYGYANTMDEYQKMMTLFDTLGYHERLKGAIRRNRDFKKKWVEALLKNEKEIVQIFKSYGYPTNKVFVSFRR